MSCREPGDRRYRQAGPQDATDDLIAYVNRDSLVGLVG